MAETYDGRCACGAVTYRLTSAPMFVHCCNCLDCQRQTGSAFVVNALIETDRIEVLSGEIVPVALPTDSGRPHDVYRCTECQTAMWSDYGRRPKLRFVRVGTLEMPSAIEPDVYIYARSKQPWVRFPDGARVFSEYYDMKKEWPEASLARRRAILGDR